MGNEEVEVFKCKLNGCGPALILTADELGAITHEILILHDGDSMEIEKTYMSKKDFDNMEEFGGW